MSDVENDSPNAARPAVDFRPTATWSTLQQRAALLREVRHFFEQRGFWEVETPLLSRDTVVDPHIDPWCVTAWEDPRTPQVGRRLWLQTSPEFGMKRLLASGADCIYQITKAFRGGEQGRLHNPEFTIVEWYRVGDGLQEGVALLAELAKTLLAVDTVERLSYAEAFEQYLRIDPHRASLAQLTRAAHGLTGTPPPSLGDDRDAWLNYLLATAVEPHLGCAQPTILFDYPASQAALARTRWISDQPPYEVAERFELYCQGIELANGYHELLDPAVLRKRNTTANRLRQADGRFEVPGDSRLLAAMDYGLPPCAGVALGLDRLLMIRCGARDIREVLAFPIDVA